MLTLSCGSETLDYESYLIHKKKCFKKLGRTCEIDLSKSATMLWVTGSNEYKEELSEKIEYFFYQNNSISLLGADNLWSLSQCSLALAAFGNRCVFIRNCLLKRNGN